MTWQNVLIGSSKLNDMKREIDSLLSMLKGLAERSRIDQTKRTRDGLTSIEFRFDLDGKEGSKCFLVFARTVEQPGISICLAVPFRNLEGLSLINRHFQAAVLSPEDTVLLHGKLQQLLAEFCVYYPDAIPDMEFIAKQA